MSGSNSNVPPAPSISIGSDGTNFLTGKIITNESFLFLGGTAVPDSQSVQVFIDGAPAGSAPIHGSAITGFVLLPMGTHSVAAVETDANGSSPPSNTITVDELSAEQAGSGNPALPSFPDGISTVAVSYADLRQALNQGFRFSLISGTQILQLTDGQYSITTGAFTPTQSSGTSPAGGVFPTAPPGASTVNISGGDTINLASSALVNVISGANTINAMAGADTVFAGAGATVTTVNQSGSASVFFQAADAPSYAVDWFVGGTGGATLVGGANHVAVDVNSNTGTGAVFIAGSGAETLFGALSATNDAYWGSFSGGSDFMFAGSGSDALVAGGGAQTVAGGSGSDTFYLINPAVIGSIVHATEPAGFYTVYNAHKGDTIALTGYDSLYGGAGSAAASVSASLGAGASVVRLNDGTVVNFVGGAGGVSVVSS